MDPGGYTFIVVDCSATTIVASMANKYATWSANQFALLFGRIV